MEGFYQRNSAGPMKAPLSNKFPVPYCHKVAEPNRCSERR
jgi:hypothetical protein